MTKKILIATTALVAFATTASAHRAWLVPSITTLSDTNQYITVDAAISNDLFYADHQPMNTDGIKVWAPDGTTGQIANAAKGQYRSVFDVKIDKPGTWRIGTADSNVGGTFKVNGELWGVGRGRGGMGPGGPGGPGAGRPGGPAAPGGARPPAPQAGGPGEGGPRPPMIAPDHRVATVAEIPAGATELNLTESVMRNEFYVTAGAPTQTLFQPTNKGLEMVPVTHPDELVSNEPGQFRFLVDGKPAAGLKVSVVPGNKRFRETEQAAELTTAADGLLTVKWPVPGVYWINATVNDDKPSVAKATKRRLAYTITVEVPAP